MSERKTCPACGESVRGDARFCCYCEHEFGDMTRSRMGVLPSMRNESGELSLTRLGVTLIVLGSLIAAAAMVLF